MLDEWVLIKRRVLRPTNPVSGMVATVGAGVKVVLRRTAPGERVARRERPIAVVVLPSRMPPSLSPRPAETWTPFGTPDLARCRIRALAIQSVRCVPSDTVQGSLARTVALDAPNPTAVAACFSPIPRPHPRPVPPGCGTECPACASLSPDDPSVASLCCGQHGRRARQHLGRD